MHQILWSISACFCCPWCVLVTVLHPGVFDNLDRLIMLSVLVCLIDCRSFMVYGLMALEITNLLIEFGSVNVSDEQRLQRK